MLKQIAKCFDMIIYCRFIVLIGARQVTRQEINNLSTDEKFPANENLSTDKNFFQHTIVLPQVISFLEGRF